MHSYNYSIHIHVHVQILYRLRVHIYKYLYLCYKIDFNKGYSRYASVHMVFLHFHMDVHTNTQK